MQRSAWPTWLHFTFKSNRIDSIGQGIVTTTTKYLSVACGNVGIEATADR